MIKVIFCFFAIFLPQRLKRFFYSRFMGWSIDSTAVIGLSFICVKKLKLSAGGKIGHFNVLKGLELVEIGSNSTIASFNWITGFPLGSNSRHFSTDSDRCPSLVVGKSSAITSRHLIDCTNKFEIGDFSTFAGFRSQVLTHAINIYLNVQESRPVKIGDYCFIGTGCIFLPGSVVPDFSVVGAGSVVNKVFTDEFVLYAGVPARKVKVLDVDSIRYMYRKEGYVW
jgi:acetyltransferase-like isoleucine patch superfamily enzyme